MKMKFIYQFLHIRLWTGGFMSGKNWQEADDAAEEELLAYFLEQLTLGTLIDLLKRKIDAGQANVGDVISQLADDPEAAVIVMKRA